MVNIKDIIKEHKKATIAAGVAAISIGCATGVVLYSLNSKDVSKEVVSSKPAVEQTIDLKQDEEQPTPAVEEKKQEPAPVVEQQPVVSDITEMNAVYYALGQVNIRADRDANSNLVYTLADNQAIQVTGKANDGTWYQVNWQGATGYVKSNLLSDKEKVVTSAPSSPSKTPGKSNGDTKASNGGTTSTTQTTGGTTQQTVSYPSGYPMSST